MTQDRIAEILDCWFAPEAEARWFQTDAAFDQEIGERFRADFERAAGGGLAD